MTIRRRDGVSFEPSGDTVVILDGDGTVITTLNPVGAVIWKALDGTRDAAALAADLVAEFEGVAIADLETDIKEFVASLVEANLVDLG